MHAIQAIRQVVFQQKVFMTLSAMCMNGQMKQLLQHAHALAVQPQVDTVILQTMAGIQQQTQTPQNTAMTEFISAQVQIAEQSYGAVAGSVGRVQGGSTCTSTSTLLALPLPSGSGAAQNLNLLLRLKQITLMSGRFSLMEMCLITQKGFIRIAQI